MFCELHLKIKMKRKSPEHPAGCWGSADPPALLGCLSRSLCHPWAPQDPREPVSESSAASSGPASLCPELRWVGSLPLGATSVLGALTGHGMARSSRREGGGLTQTADLRGSPSVSPAPWGHGGDKTGERSATQRPALAASPGSGAKIPAPASPTVKQPPGVACGGLGCTEGSPLRGFADPNRRGSRHACQLPPETERELPSYPRPFPAASPPRSAHAHHQRKQRRVRKTQ